VIVFANIFNEHINRFFWHPYSSINILIHKGYQSDQTNLSKISKDAFIYFCTWCIN
jgi:hypothetical protein